MQQSSHEHVLLQYATVQVTKHVDFHQCYFIAMGISSRLDFHNIRCIYPNQKFTLVRVLQSANWPDLRLIFMKTTDRQKVN